MGLNRDLIRHLERKNRLWQRTLREKAYQRKTLVDHSHEFTEVLNGQKGHLRQRHKINQMRHH
ncbi:MAG: hypothetical protein V7750_17455 [Sneathiella sp.]